MTFKNWGFDLELALDHQLIKINSILKFKPMLINLNTVTYKYICTVVKGMLTILKNLHKNIPTIHSDLGLLTFQLTNKQTVVIHWWNHIEYQSVLSSFQSLFLFVIRQSLIMGSIRNYKVCNALYFVTSNLLVLIVLTLTLF